MNPERKKRPGKLSQSAHMVILKKWESQTS